MKAQTHTEFEQECIANAVAYTAVRGSGFSRVRHDCKTMEEAEAKAAEYGDGRTMIYAVTAKGFSAHVKNA